MALRPAVKPRRIGGRRRAYTGPDTLFKRLNGRYTDFAPYGGVIQMDPEIEQAFYRMKDLRDELSHFSPKGWSIEKRMILSSVAPLLSLIEKIHSCGRAFLHLDQPEDMKSLIDEILISLKKWEK